MDRSVLGGHIHDPVDYICRLFDCCRVCVLSQAAPIIFTASLDGASENPPNAVDSLGTGLATVTYDDSVSTLRVQIGFTGLTGFTTAAHIHCCVATPATPTSQPHFPISPWVNGAYDYVLDLTMVSSFGASFVGLHGGTAASSEAALLAGLLAGLAYVNIHTTVFPGGEIRGFLTTVPEPAGLALV